jgi:hypothetical protein
MSWALLLLGYGNAVVKAIFTWLSHRSLWQLVSMALCAALMVQHFALKAEQRHSAKVEQQLIKANAELKRISSARNEQKQETAERIKVVTRTIHDADERAKAVETAPLKSECKTPDAVLQADL